MLNLQRHIDSHTVCGEVWPDDAVYLVNYEVKTWPCPSQDYHQFFKSRDELDAWIKDQRDWARLEDNFFSIHGIYEWDWGPQRMVGY